VKPIDFRSLNALLASLAKGTEEDVSEVPTAAKRRPQGAIIDFEQ